MEDRSQCILIGAFGILLSGAALTVLLLNGLGREGRLLLRGTKTTGVVTAVRRYQDVNGDDGSNFTYTFQAPEPGSKNRSVLRSYASNAPGGYARANGDAVEVLYLPENPRVCALRSEANVIVVLLLTALTALFGWLFAVSVWLLWQGGMFNWLLPLARRAGKLGAAVGIFVFAPVRWLGAGLGKLVLAPMIRLGSSMTLTAQRRPGQTWRDRIREKNLERIRR